MDPRSKIPALALIGLSLTECGKDDSIVGTWTTIQVDMDKFPMVEVMASIGMDDNIWDLLDDDSSFAWQAEALCAQTDPEAFFPEKGGSTREAKRVCQSCTVRTECLEYALAHDERFGIWGGLSERERRKLKQRA